MTIPTLTDRLQAATTKAEGASQIMHDVANSGPAVDVSTTSGPVPSIQKWFADLNDRTSGAVGLVEAALDAEVLARQGADSALSTRIDDLGPADVGAEPAQTLASPGEMEGGTEAGIRSMSPQLIAHAIANLVPPEIGSGGNSSTGSVTLTSASVGAQYVKTTAWGQFVKLPNATYCRLGATLFSIHNAGGYPLMIKDSDGQVLGFVNSKETCRVGLADDTTAAGRWVLSGHKLYGLDVSARIYFPAPVGTTFDRICSVAIDSARTLVLFSGDTSLQGVVYDDATSSFGPPTIIRSSGTGVFVKAAQIDGSRVLVVSCAGGTTLQAVVLSVSGTTITLNAAAAASLASAVQSFGDWNIQDGVGLTKVGSSFVFGYLRGSVVGAIRAIEVSGTTATIGDELASNHGIVPFAYRLSDTAFLLVSKLSATNIVLTTYTLSGTTFTLGTSLAIPATVALMRFKPLSSGRFALTYINGTAYCSLVSLSGLVLSHSAVQYGASGSAGAAFINEVGSKLIVGSATSGAYRVNVITDTSGTASAGSELTIDVTSTNYCFAGNYGEKSCVAVDHNNTGMIVTIGIDGSNPAVVGRQAIAWPTATQVSTPDFGQALNGDIASYTTLVGAVSLSLNNAYPYSSLGSDGVFGQVESANYEAGKCYRHAPDHFWFATGYTNIVTGRDFHLGRYRVIAK